MPGSVRDRCNLDSHRRISCHWVSLLLFTHLLDDAGLDSVLENTACWDESTTGDEGRHLRPRTIRILFEGIAG